MGRDAPEPKRSSQVASLVEKDPVRHLSRESLSLDEGPRFPDVHERDFYGDARVGKTRRQAGAVVELGPAIGAPSGPEDEQQGATLGNVTQGDRLPIVEALRAKEVSAALDLFLTGRLHVPGAELR
jgi:hypothetical protein